MSYPELYSDERVVLQAQNVKVKSVLFEVVLTTRRLVLIDAKKNSLPPQEINLATLKDVESGENAIRDPTITISIITISGNTRQMVLTYSKTSGGERRREVDEWVRALRQNITSTVYHPVTQGPAPREAEPAPEAEHPAQPPAAVQPPQAAPHRIEITNTPPPKKRIEIARPMKKIVEAPPTMPVPVETTSLPTGSFCNRCGNRVPPESAFCNRCGTPVARDAEFTGVPSMAEESPVPPVPQAPAVPQVHVAPSPIFPTIADKKDRPIEEVIHSIEPLIEDSVPRTAPAPLVPAKQVHYHPPAETTETAAPPLAEPQGTMFEAAAAPGEVQWPVLTKTGVIEPPADQVQVPPVPPAPPAPEPLPAPAPRKIPVKIIAVLAIVVIAILAGAFVFMQNPPGIPGATPTPTPEITTVATTIPRTTVVPATTIVPVTTPKVIATPQAVIPASGVWVRVAYSGKYTGSIGTPGRLRDVTDTGDHFYQISTSTGPVVVTVQKSDGSSATMTVDVYKDGKTVKHDTTSAPKGMVEFQATFTPETPAAATPAP